MTETPLSLTTTVVLPPPNRDVEATAVVFFLKASVKNLFAPISLWWFTHTLRMRGLLSMISN